MSRVLALVEGQTEQAFVRDVLAPELGNRGVFISATLIGKPGHKGGIRSYESVQRDILAALKQDIGRSCTTMFDYYGLQADWPGVPEARSLPTVANLQSHPSHSTFTLSITFNPIFSSLNCLSHLGTHVMFLVA